MKSLRNLAPLEKRDNNDLRGSILRQFLHGPEKIIRLRKNGIFESGLVSRGKYLQRLRGGLEHRAYRTAGRQFAPRFQRRSPSSTYLRKPPVHDCFRDRRRNVSQSKGFRQGKSINSTFTPCSRSIFCAACSARGTTAP